jgi:hypothetical protein
MSLEVTMRVTSLLVAVFMAATAALAAGQEKQPATPERLIVDEVLKAYGGEQALGRIKTVFAKGAVKAFMLGDEGMSTRYFQRPRKLRAELAYKNSAETRILNGSRGWRSSNGKPLAEVIGPPFLGMVYQYKYLDLPFGFLDNGFTISLLPREKLHDMDVDVLLLADAEGPPMRVYLDVKTRLIARVAGVFSFGSVGTELIADFSDYRVVEGVRFPFRITNYSGENKIAETVVNELRLNQEMRDTLFQP